jgi:hypothetical protein
MSYFKTPYDTTALAGSKAQLSKVVDALTRARIQRYIYPLPKSPYVYAVQRSSVLDEMVPTFHHPVVQDVSGETVVYVDVRSYGKIDLSSFDFKVTNEEGYNSTLLLARLEEMWVTGNTASIRALKLPAQLYPAWISENITRALNLGPGDQATIAILAGIFYLSLFSDKKVDDEDDRKSLIVSQVARNTSIKPDVVQPIVNRIDYIADVSEFCTIVREELDNVRANNLNPATLYSLLSGTWFGPNSAELVAVSLEHPPTWVTVVYRAATNRSYHNARLAKMISDRNVYKNEVRNFVISLRTQD